MSDEPPVLVERFGPRGELVLNRPERRNALTGPVVEALHAGLDDLVADESIRVILVRGAGGTFCAGLDVREFALDPPPPWRARFGTLWAGFHAAMYECPRPIVGALEGAAIAAGSALALACDFLVAGAGARFHVAEAAQGRGPAPINTAWLEWRYGAARAIEFTVGARPRRGDELAAAGMAARAVPDDEALAAARAFADDLAENDPASMARAKALIRALRGVDDFHARLRAAQEH